MMAKLTSKNQITLPKAIISDFQGAEYFEVTNEDGKIVLTPVIPSRADKVRKKLADLGITEQDVSDAITWARHNG